MTDLDVVVEPDETARRLREYVRNHPEVRHEDYRECDNPVRESCYVLAESYFHLKGGQDSGLDIYCLSWNDVDDRYDGTHWFLRDGDTVIDLSLPSPEAGDSVPWDVARCRAFITGYQPSNRTERVLEEIDISDTDDELVTAPQHELDLEELEPYVIEEVAYSPLKVTFLSSGYEDDIAVVCGSCDWETTVGDLPEDAGGAVQPDMCPACAKRNEIGHVRHESPADRTLPAGWSRS